MKSYDSFPIRMAFFIGIIVFPLMLAAQESSWFNAKKVADNVWCIEDHGAPIESSFISEQIACVKSILDGTCESKDNQSFAGDGKICTFKRASVA